MNQVTAVLEEIVAAGSASNVVVPTDELRVKLEKAICAFAGLQLAKPEDGLQFREERFGWVSADRTKFVAEASEFIHQNMSFLKKLGFTQLGIVCHNIRDNGENLWGDRVRIGGRWR